MLYHLFIIKNLSKKTGLSYRNKIKAIKFDACFIQVIFIVQNMRNLSVNTLGAWIAFAIALTIYMLTLEPTASLWDCSEFIACAYRLEIAHPPGAPLFILLGRFFSLLAMGDVTKVAMMVNFLSALASAFTIFFLFLTIVWLIKKIVPEGAPYRNFQVLIGAFVGALAYAVTDSFWFSAVEGEVYATSSLFTAAVFWLILKWEEEYEKPGSVRWILLIFFLLGLSVGVHLLNLLAIPAIAMVVYFKSGNKSTKGFVRVFGIAAAILLFLIFIYIPGIVNLGSWVDLFAVNNLGLSVNTGFFIYFILLVAALIYAIIYSYKKKKHILYISLLSVGMLTLGYSCYSSIIIRSIANPAIDMSNPDNPFSLLHYLNREQYGSRPLVVGAYYNAPVTGSEERFSYVPYKGKYEKISMNPEYEYDSRFKTFFPRMSSSEGRHVEAYKRWGKVEGTPIRVNRGGETTNIMKPTFGENLRFFFRYQVGHMYMRYFLWNFSGRQNDIQGFGGILHGNWITGIPFLDNARLGPQDQLPDSYQNNKANNKYFMLPLILGLIGLLFQYRRHRDGFWVVMLLYFFTGLAIVIYLNEVPITPRERDYVYVGSFYAFAMWIGLAVPAIFQWLGKRIGNKASMPVAGLITILAAPVLIGAQNWDDHNRSARTIARDLGYNYLGSTRPNAILFTSADNDTYPAWYVQEVEGFRRDVRQVLQPYLSANWYIEQQRRDMPHSKGLPLSLEEGDLLGDRLNYIPVVERIKEPPVLIEMMKFIKSDDPRTKVTTSQREQLNFVPSSTYRIPVDTTKFPGAPAYIEAKIAGQYIMKADIILLDVLAHNNWERPLYVQNPSVMASIGLQDYLVPEGIAFRFTPFKNSSDEVQGAYNAELFGSVFQWGNIHVPQVYPDWTTRRTLSLVLRLREKYNALAAELLQKGDKEAAEAMLNRAYRMMPHSQLPFGLYAVESVDLYMKLGKDEEAKRIFSLLREEQESMISFLDTVRKSLNYQSTNELRMAFYTYQELLRIARTYNFEEADDMQEKLSFFSAQFGG